MRIKIGWGSLDGNHHVMTKKPGGPHPPCEGYDFATKVSTIGLCVLGRDSWLLAEGRKVWGLRLWLYGPTGACVHFDIGVVFKKCPCAPGSKYGPKDDGGLGTIVL